MLGFGHKTGTTAPEPSAELALLPDDVPVIMVFTLDIDAAALPPVIAQLDRRFARHKLVFVHSALDFRPFMEAKTAFEVLPSFHQMAAFPDLVNWPRYLEDRRALLLSKWRPSRAIAYGFDLQGYADEAARRFGGRA